MDWTEKYRPLHLSEIIGNTAAVRKLNDWAKNWTAESKPLLLTGKPGIGKTSAAHALARDYRWEVLELNASDARTKTVIERVAGNSSKTMSLFGSDKKLIIIDESDNLEGNADRGGARAIADILKEAQQPVILIANDAYGVSDSIRRLCEPVLFRAIPSQTIFRRLREICITEGISCSDDALAEISESSGGDMRSAVNMIFGSAAGKVSVTAKDVNTSQKDERANIFDLTGAVFSAVPDERISALSRECDEKPDYVMQWIEESVPSVSSNERRVRAYRRLSRADVYLGRTMRRQYYTMWRYASYLMTSGVAAENAGSGFRPRVMPPSRWKRMSTAKKQKTVRNSLNAALNEGFSIPENQIKYQYLDLLSIFAKAHPYEFCERFDLDADEMTVLIKDKSRASEVFKEVQKAAKERDIKKKKIAAAKKSKAAKSKEQSPVIEKINVSEMKAEAEIQKVPEEKKPTASQATLDFF